MSGPLQEIRDPAARRTATIVAVTFAALLCVVALFLAFRSLGGTVPGAAAPPSIAPQTAGDSEPASDEGEGEGGDDAEGGEDAEPPPEDAIAFSSPTGNIGCTLSSDGARCDVDNRDWDPPAKPDSCDEDWGRGITIGPDGPAFTCASDSVLGGAQVLSYGDTVTRGDFTCRSEESGMACTSSAGAGFVVARASYEVL